MTVNFNKPENTDRYTGVLAQLRDNIKAVAKQALSGADNAPEGAIRFSDANSRWEKYAGGAWGALRAYATEVFEMTTRNARELDRHDRAYYESAASIKTGTIEKPRIPALGANKIIKGVFAAARIPDLAASKITSGVLAAARIPGLAASKITSGVFAATRIPNLPANKITSGAFAAARIPGLPADKIVSGLLDPERLPNTLAVRGIQEVTVEAETIGSGNALSDVALAVTVVGRTLTISLALHRLSVTTQNRQNTQNTQNTQNRQNTQAEHR